MSRLPIREQKLILPEGDGWFPALRLVLDSPLGPVQALVVHLRPPVSDGGSFVSGHFTAPAIHEKEITRFCQALDHNLPTMVVGDFNEEDDGRAIAYLARAEWRMKSALPQFAPDRPTWRWPTTFHTFERQLDHIIYDFAPGAAQRRGDRRRPLRSLPGRGRVRPRAHARVAIIRERLLAPLGFPPRHRLPPRDRLLDHLAALPRPHVRRARRRIRVDRARQIVFRWRASAAAAAPACPSRRAQNRRRPCASGAPARRGCPHRRHRGAPWRSPPGAASSSAASRASSTSAVRRAPPPWPAPAPPRARRRPAGAAGCPKRPPKLARNSSLKLVFCDPTLDLR